MTKVIFRPEPVIDPTSNQRIQHTGIVQNREASARLFEQALVRVEANRRTDGKAQASFVQQQVSAEQSGIETSANRIADFQSDFKHDMQLQPQHDIAEVVEEPDLQESTERIEDEQTDVEPEDTTSDELQSSLPVFFSPEFSVSAGLQYPDAYEFGHNQENSLSDTSGTGTSDQSEIGTTDSNTESGVSQLSNLSELYELVQDTDGLSGVKEWSFTIEGEASLSALTLSVEADGAWRVGITVPPDSNAVDPSILTGLQQRLENCGLTVAGVSLQGGESQSLSSPERDERHD